MQRRKISQTSDHLGNRSLKENELIGIQLEIHFLLYLVPVNEVDVLSCCHVLVPDQSGLDVYNKKCKTCTWINRSAQSPSYRSKNERDEKWRKVVSLQEAYLSIPIIQFIKQSHYCIQHFCRGTFPSQVSFNYVISEQDNQIKNLSRFIIL